MVTEILSYVIAVVAIGLNGIPQFILNAPLLGFYKKYESDKPYLIGTFTTCAVAIVAAIAFAVWLIRLIGQEPTYLMFIAAAFFMLSNDYKRIDSAVRGTSGVRQMMERQGEGEYYDQKGDIRAKQAELWGDLVGWFAGVFLFIKWASFI